jgi:hypothetical protein
MIPKLIQFFTRIETDSLIPTIDTNPKREDFKIYKEYKVDPKKARYFVTYKGHYLNINFTFKNSLDNTGISYVGTKQEAIGAINQTIEEYTTPTIEEVTYD